MPPDWLDKMPVGGKPRYIEHQLDMVAITKLMSDETIRSKLSGWQSLKK